MADVLFACRFSFTTKARESGASSTNNDNLVNNQLTNEMILFVTSRGNSDLQAKPHVTTVVLTEINVKFCSFPRHCMQLVVFRDMLAGNNNLRTRLTQQPRLPDSELSPEEQRESIKMLKKEIYNPMPKKIIKRLGRFYRQNSAAAKASTGQKNEKKMDEDDDDDYKKCVICLEDFELKEVVMVTPCNHIFHEDCILPWVKSHGRCPVCRFSFTTKAKEIGESSTNNDNLVNNRLTNEMIPFVTSRGNSGTTIQPFRF
ncbi:zinc finger, RING/FYVE/PHD-type [Artemisia annua]|uniref:Zinc finger, RING/FYVE/PHD-type n=1 Tax=Artemisia annua TaxID=35608 RepID=A0A2U1M2K6_ARTAN|nr:zinc finger, RING/FYVE/PHD-type [Artemisia annua]